jgi:cytochrome c553
MFLCLVALGMRQAPPDALAWAYNISPAPPPGATAAPPAGDNDARRQLPGAAQSFTLAEIRNAFGPADWFPQDHPPMPDVVARGRRPNVRACSLCHYPNGKGRPENAGIAGLPVAYFVQTMADFKDDLRKSAEPRKANTNTMIAIAKDMSDEEVRAAAAYFASMKWTPWIKVVETDTVPRTRIAGGMFLPLGDQAGTEPIGQRIVEMPANPAQTDLRDPRSGFVAYVPTGSVAKGKYLVTTGGAGRTVACTVCHGDGLAGLGPVPGIAGRSPSYVARQLHDMRQGARRGAWSPLMTAAVAQLTTEDILNIAAYTSSLVP